MILTRKALSRRTLLRGVGASLALPLLDAMVPALSAAPLPVRRLGWVYIPMGCNPLQWFPAATTGRLTQLSPILSPLTPYLDQLTVFRNVENKNAYSAGNHATANSAYLSAAKARQTEGTDYELGTTVDQIAAQHLGRETAIPSLELGMDILTTVGDCDNGFACVYQNNLSWSSPTSPLPAEAHPRVVFERIFGDGGTAGERRAELKRNASILDWVNSDIASLKKELGNSDKTRVDHYLESVREVERRIQKAESKTTDGAVPDADRPVGVPAAYADHVKLMFDLQVLAMQADATRVFTFQLARETSGRSYPEVGVSDPHPPLTHHSNDPEKMARLAIVNRYHVSLFAYFLEKLKTTREGDSNLLDNSLFLYGSGMGNPDVHDHINLPLVVAGGAAGQVKGAQYIQYKDPTPLANLHLTLLNRAGVQMEKFADSTGKVVEL